LSARSSLRLSLVSISAFLAVLEGGGVYDVELLDFVEVEQVDFAKGVEIVACAWQYSLYGILDLDVCYEPALSFAPPALRWAPGGAVVTPALAVGALPEVRVPDSYGPRTSNSAYLQLCW